MATAATPEHVETHSAPIAENTRRAEVRTLQVDGNFLAVLGVGIALFALAFGAFTHLSGRIDGTATELRSEIKDVNVKVDKLDAKLSGRMDNLDAKIEKVATDLRAENRELNAKMDRVDTKIDAMNARLDRLFELVASQGRREPQ